MRASDELIETNEPGWALIEEWLKEAKMAMKFYLEMRAGRKVSFWDFRSPLARRWERLFMSAAA